MTSQYGTYALRAGLARLHANAHAQLLIAFPLQQWFRERVSMLRYTYIVCLVDNYPLKF